MIIKNIKAARKRLRDLSDGKYFSIGLEISERKNLNLLEQICRVYISGYGWHEGSTWDKAFDSLERRTGLKNKITY